MSCRIARSRRHTRRGFTLLEVLLVLVILAVLGSMANVYFRGAQKRANRDAAVSQIARFKQALEMYQMSVNSYPSTGQGLDALLRPPSDLPNQEKWGPDPYLDSSNIPPDPWGNPYQYTLLDAGQYRITSNGPDGVSGTEDDIANDTRTQ